MICLSDPYRILGVSPDATDDEIKKAYRNLAKKYHPDKYANTPLADTASEKMKEINDAYDRITKMRKEGASYTAGAGYASAGQTRTGAQDPDGRYYSVRVYINSGDFASAERILSGVPPTERNAEWYYLMGIIYLKNGQLETANNYFATACRLDPSNAEYAAMYNNIRQQRQGYYGGYNNRSSYYSGDNCLSDLCCLLACFQCCSCCGRR